jgi:hypothetical protein
MKLFGCRSAARFPVFVRAADHSASGFAAFASRSPRRRALRDSTLHIPPRSGRASAPSLLSTRAIRILTAASAPLSLPPPSRSTAAKKALWGSEVGSVSRRP